MNLDNENVLKRAILESILNKNKSRLDKTLKEVADLTLNQMIVEASEKVRKSFNV